MVVSSALLISSTVLGSVSGKSGTPRSFFAILGLLITALVAEHIILETEVAALLLPVGMYLLTFTVVFLIYRKSLRI